jgi:septal ring-binding cell division protein DamX
LRSGAFGDAASGFAADLKTKARGRFSVQLLVACSEETIQKAVAAVPDDELFILPVSYKGRECFRLCWGVYGNAAGAAAAGRSLPEYFVRGGAAPHVMSAAELLK